MANPKLDIGEIVRWFPGQVVTNRGFPAYNLDSPFDVAIRENQIQAVTSELDLGPKIPAHYLVYAQGKPGTREQSRIGGLPYRPRKLEWPHDTNGKLKEFVCQIDFSDSRSIVPELPGDVMLLFASEEGMDENPFKLEWYPSGMDDLIGENDLPRFNFMFPMVQRESVFCYLYETYDFPEAKAKIKGTRFEAWHSFGVPCGSKIGGVDESGADTGQCVFTLESIRLLIGDPYPFVNRRDWKPVSLAGKILAGIVETIRKPFPKPRTNPCYDILMIGDLGRIHIMKQANGEFRATDISY